MKKRCLLLYIIFWRNLIQVLEMSRHRDVRSMNYSEEYDGYDDVYGHSVEDDYCVSPSAEQFLFDRSKQQNIASFITEPDIVEDNEDIDDSALLNEDNTVLTELEEAKLVSCMESMKNIIGDTVPEPELRKQIIKSKFDAEIALDKVLKESSPKNVIETPVANKNSAEHNPGATTIKLESTLFTTPKFSFKKSENTLETTSTNLSINNSSFQNLSSNSTTSLSSLTGMIANHTKLTSSPIKKVPTENNTTAFRSLADLTAHHLQKSSNSINGLKYSDKVCLSNTNFVIPKLSIKRDNGNDFKNTQILKLANAQNTGNMQSNSCDTYENHSIGLLQNSLSNSLILSANNTETKSKIHDLQTKFQGLTTRINDTRTPSPSECVIDLSTALKEAGSLVSNNSNQTNSKVLSNVYNNIPSLTLYPSDNDIGIPYLALPTILNLSSLKNMKLSHTKNDVSLFGKTLCKIWKLRKPIIKCQEQENKVIKRFDFSTPYSRI